MIYTYIIIAAVLATSVGIGFYLFEKIDYVERQNRLVFKTLDELIEQNANLRKNVVGLTLTDIANLQKRLQANDNNFSEFQASIENTVNILNDKQKQKDHESQTNISMILNTNNKIDSQIKLLAKMSEEIDWLKLKLANQPPLKLKVYFPRTKKKSEKKYQVNHKVNWDENDHGTRAIDEKLVKSIKTKLEEL
jgi:hypothetical protein